MGAAATLRVARRLERRVLGRDVRALSPSCTCSPRRCLALPSSREASCRWAGQPPLGLVSANVLSPRQLNFAAAVTEAAFTAWAEAGWAISYYFACSDFRYVVVIAVPLGPCDGASCQRKAVPRPQIALHLNRGIRRWCASSAMQLNSILRRPMSCTGPQADAQRCNVPVRGSPTADCHITSCDLDVQAM